MKLQFLGTSAGAPTRQRNVTSLAVMFEQRRDWYMFDCGEATQHQLLRSGFSPARLSKIFITHLHGDHVFGLPGLLSSRSMTISSKRPVTIYGPKGIKDFVQSALRLSATHLSFALEFFEFTQAGLIYENESERVETIRLSHDVPSFAYKLTEAARRGRTIIIGGDNDTPSLLGPHLSGVDLLIHEATLTESVRASQKFQARHSTAREVAMAAQQGGIKNLILTHISARFSPQKKRPDNAELSIDDVMNEARAHFSGNLYIASDFDIFELARDGSLDRNTEPL